MKSTKGFSLFLFLFVLIIIQKITAQSAIRILTDKPIIIPVIPIAK